MIHWQTQVNWWAAARQQGLVQGDAPDTDANEPTALVIAMAMLGTLACIVPLAIFLALSLGEHLLMGAGGVLLGVLFLAGGGLLLRQSGQAFASCAALVLWGLGGGLLAVNLGGEIFESLPGAALLNGMAAALFLLGAWLARKRWVQSVMGFGWAVAMYGLLMAVQGWAVWLIPLGLESLLLALLWWLWLRAEPARLAQPLKWSAQMRWAAFADAAIVGVLCVIALQVYGGRMLDIFFSNSGWNSSLEWMLGARRWLAAVAALIATGLLVRTWQQRGVLAQRMQYLLLLTGALLAVCAWFSPSMGVVVVVAAAALLGARWRIAILCAVIALGLLGNFYYYLTWPLAAKGMGLAVLGAVLMAGLWLLRERALTGDVAAPSAPKAFSGREAKRPWAWVLLGAVLVFGLVNWDVRGKEQVIAHGQRILVPLVPVDPRSLMQGDYMALRFDLPAEVTDGLENILAPVAYVRATVDANGVASVQKLVADSAAPATGEVTLPLKRLKGQWVLVTDAYFFPEGQGKHFEKGKYGDFRVLPDGRALLVGLADADGQLIQPLPGGPIWSRADAAASAEPPGDEGSPDAMQELATQEAKEATEAAVEAAEPAAEAAEAAATPPAIVKPN